LPEGVAQPNPACDDYVSGYLAQRMPRPRAQVVCASQRDRVAWRYVDGNREGGQKRVEASRPGSGRPKRMNIRSAAMILIVELRATTTGSASLNLTATPTYRARARSFYKEDVESPCSRFNEFLARAQRLVGRSPTPWQRARPCCFQQLRQHDDHRREMGTRGHIDLWTGRREATGPAP